MDNGGIIGPTNTVSSGGNKVTVQTSNGNITTQPGTTRANVLVVAGGGGGGDSGAGAGGLVFIESASICAATAYPAVIGGGGSAGNNGMNPGYGTVGTDSTFFGLTAKGGGRGAASNVAGQDGGSGSGGGGTDAGSNLAGGATTQGCQPGNSGTFGFGNAEYLPLT